MISLSVFFLKVR